MRYKIVRTGLSHEASGFRTSCSVPVRAELLRIALPSMGRFVWCIQGSRIGRRGM